MAQLWNRLGLHLLQRHFHNGIVLCLPDQEVGFGPTQEAMGSSRCLGDDSGKSYQNAAIGSGWPSLLSLDIYRTGARGDLL